MLQNIVDFKVQSFLNERNTSTMAYEVKAVRAIWDPSLSIPGTNRRGGWRCPVGTRYGGQITDRFGRSCGWGVARRIANQISDIGQRLENVDDARRGRRIARRERRILARLNPQDARAGRLERGLRGVAERLEGGEASTRRGGRRREVAARTPSVDTPEAPRELTPAPQAPRRRRAPTRRQPNGGNLRESEQRRMEREIEQPGAPRTGEAPARRRRRAVAQTVNKPKAPVRKPEAVVEPKIVKPRRPKPKIDLREPDASLERILDEEAEVVRRPGNSDNAARSEELRQNREAMAQAAIADAAQRRQGEQDGFELKPPPVNGNPQDNPFDSWESKKLFERLNDINTWIKKARKYLDGEGPAPRNYEQMPGNATGVSEQRTRERLREIIQERDRIKESLRKRGYADAEQARLDFNRFIKRRREQPVQPAQPPRPAAPLGNPNNFLEIAERLKIRGNNFPSDAYERLLNEWDKGEAKIEDVDDRVQKQIDNFEFGENFPETGMRQDISRNIDEMNERMLEIERDLALLEPIINDGAKFREREELARKVIYNQQEIRFLRKVNRVLEKEIEALGNLSTPSSVRRMDDTIDSGERSSKPSATTPKPPKAPAPGAQNALPAGWNQGPGTIITHKNGDIIDQQAVTNTWFVVYRGAPAKEGFATREEAIAWHKQNVLDRNNAPAAAAGKKDIRNVPDAIKHSPPKIEPAKFKAEHEQIIEQGLLDIKDAKKLGRFGLLVDQAIFNENEGRQGSLREFQRELQRVAAILRANPNMTEQQLFQEIQRAKQRYVSSLNQANVGAIKTKLAEYETELTNRFRELRTPGGNGAEQKETKRIEIMQRISDLKRYIGSYEATLKLIEELEPEIRKASERIKQGYVFDPDAINIPKPTPEDVKKKIKDQISAGIDRRQGKLAKYLKERYPNGGAPYEDMTPDKWARMSREEKSEYIRQAYSHPMIKGANGKFYNAVAQVSLNGTDINVKFNEVNAKGEIIRERIGSSSREISFAGGKVSQSTMFINSQLDRGADIQTIYNQHAFLYLSKIGITKASVGMAADDGRYVWARVGFKNQRGLNAADLKALEEPLKFYEEFGPGGLISNDAEYARIKSILTQARGGTKFHQQDIIFAIDDSPGDKLRGEYVKKWFVKNLPIPSGTLKFKDEKVGGEPARQPRRARAPRVPTGGRA